MKLFKIVNKEKKIILFEYIDMILRIQSELQQQQKTN